MNTLFADLKFSLRLLAKTPGFTLAAIAVLALGIGLNTAIFSVIHALAFSARPFPDAGQVVQLYSQSEKDPAQFRAFSYSAYRELRDTPGGVFTGVLAHNLTMVGIGDGAEARRSFSAIVSANYFDVLGIKLLRGRSFTAAEEKPGANLPVVIASHRYWQRLGYPPDLVGSLVRINERPYTIVGLAPEGFTGTMMLVGAELYFPLGVFDSLNNDFDSLARRTLESPAAYNLFLVARLAPGVSRTAAGSALTAAADSLEHLYPVEQKEQTVVLADLPRLGTSTAPNDEGALRSLAVVLLGMTGAVLLIVCLNLAGMMLARGHARRKEFAIRLALGGGRARLIRQLLTEGLVLALVGGTFGFFLALAAAEQIVASFSSRMPVAVFLSGSSSAAVIVATLGFAVLATLFFAFGPALKLSRPDILADLKAQAGEDAVARRSRWLPRHPLVVLQLALSLALLISAGLFIRLAHQATDFDTGYHADDTLIAEVDASLAGYDEARSQLLYRTVGEKLSALPGVQSASLGAIAPFGFINIGRDVRRAGVQPPPDTKPATAAEGLAFSAAWNAVGSDYFATMGIPLLRGRAFTRAETDATGAPAVAIIDETLAKKLFPEGDALGQHIQWAGRDADAGRDRNEKMDTPAADAAPKSMEIVGIVRATRDDFTAKEAGNTVYRPFAQDFVSNVHFHVRPALPGPAGAAALIDSVRRELRTTAAGVPVFKVRTFAQQREASLETWLVRLGATLFSVFGGLAMLVAVVGLYGIKAYAVSRRTREIGIRLALGAEPGRVQRMILREGLRLTLVGLALGFALGAGAGQVLASVFTDLPAFDPLSLAVATLGLLAAAMLACWLPARRATRVSPMTALRTE